MRQKLQILLALLLPLVSFSARAADIPVTKMDQSTVRIIAKQSDEISSGSGFVVGNGQYVVTNYHVIKGAEEVWVWAKNPQLKSRVTRVVVDSPERDLAVLELAENSGRPSVVLGLKSGVHKTQTVYAAGFPGAADDEGDSDNLTEVKYTPGIISSFIAGDNGEGLYQISAAVNPGNSGGPLFDECGRVIGINVAKSLVNAYVQGPDGQPTMQRVPLGEGIAWSIQADELLSLLRNKDIAVPSEGTPCVSGALSPPALVPAPTPPIDSSHKSGALPTLSSTNLKWLTIGGIVIFVILILVIVTLLVRSPNARAARPAHVVTPLVAPAPLLPPRPPLLVATPELRLRALSGPHKGMEFPLSETSITLGRDPAQSQVVFDKADTLIGRRHCTVRIDRAGEVVLEDCHSTNGTFLESGERLKSGESRVLGSNARFYLGSRDYMFQVK